MREPSCRKFVSEIGFDEDGNPVVWEACRCRGCGVSIMSYVACVLELGSAPVFKGWRRYLGGTWRAVIGWDWESSLAAHLGGSGDLRAGG